MFSACNGHNYRQVGHERIVGRRAVLVLWWGLQPVIVHHDALGEVASPVRVGHADPLYCLGTLRSLLTGTGGAKSRAYSAVPDGASLHTFPIFHQTSGGHYGGEEWEDINILNI